MRQTGPVREAFAHEAILTMDPGADARAPGAAITVALCGSWEHPPPCPLAPHHSHAARVADGVLLRVLFAAHPEEEQEVRRRIDEALESGRSSGPGGVTTRWRLRESRRSDVAPDEAEHARRLITD